MNPLDILQQELFGITVVRYLVASLLVLATLIVRKVADRYVFRWLHTWTSKTRFRYDDLILEAIQGPVGAIILLWGFYLATFSLASETPLDEVLRPLFMGATSIVVVWGLYRLVEVPAQWIESVLTRRDETLAAQFTPLIRKAMRITIVLLGGLLVIQNLGFSVTSLLAGLGIGGLAIALAGQDTIANLFGSLVVLTDRPMVVGDRIQIGDVQGMVESIGFRSTRIRTFEKSLVVIPNKKLASDVIENWSAQPGRRVRMTIGVQYDSLPDKFEQLLQGIRQIIAEDEALETEGQYVHFIDFGASSLDILVNYFTKTTDYQEHLVAREAINLKIMALVASLGLSFAFPSQTLYFGQPSPFEKSPGT
ncbi:MAG: mechanosensitive ion channel family protein [Fidelibacterota bacterium]|nr:MAG: mechanosensitive ion channel family protein [Candidatus Neomarinimicrobiota bacterium]